MIKRQERGRPMMLNKIGRFVILPWLLRPGVVESAMQNVGQAEWRTAGEALLAATSLAWVLLESSVSTCRITKVVFRCIGGRDLSDC